MSGMNRQRAQGSPGGREKTAAQQQAGGQTNQCAQDRVSVRKAGRMA
ncbi:hypothetical protein LHK_01246 [Laribacter hongkongensis HLHK9]|uniref:Uncharacterized protein n=1 Tax=Laribacter hongkongensis (strain HLHK9) TaxID=557598 RepID=C1D6Z6_LARHH|nr:hypothetical protein LHK_01246 [Laribacter hongkongensis HLHK9]